MGVAAEMVEDFWLPAIEMASSLLAGEYMICVQVHYEVGASALYIENTVENR